jgi:cytochrome bd-type quinol oxidase subunit 1
MGRDSKDPVATRLWVTLFVLFFLLGAVAGFIALLSD